MIGAKLIGAKSIGAKSIGAKSTEVEMTADVAGFNRRTLVFDIGVAVGLWLIVATGVYVAKEAERASLDRPAAVADARAPVVDLAAATPMSKTSVRRLNPATSAVISTSVDLVPIDLAPIDLAP